MSFRPARFLILGASALVLAACGGGGSDSAPTPTPSVVTPPPPPPAADSMTKMDTRAESARFLRIAGLGADDAVVTALTDADAADWLINQMAIAPQSYLDELSSRLVEDDAKNRDSSMLIYERLIGSDAQLRTRMAFALSQLFVISDRDDFNRGYDLANYYDILNRNAFGNYRELMGEITSNPMMGDYLTYLYNQKGDPRTGRQPDENYARELLQLFSIGLVELNMDGTAKTGADGNPIETYGNDDVVGLARVFTGYALAGTSYRWRDRFADAWRRPMTMYDEYHSELEKSFLGTTIAAGTPGEQSIEAALDAIFAHPNVAPFVSRQLIQRFTASHPQPDYVERVATAFETGRYTSENNRTFGTGERGDLSATLAAVLLDESVHDDVRLSSEGKVREPVLKFTQFAREYAKPATKRLVDGEWNRLADTSDPIEGLGQSPMKSPSVFNFYRPGHVAPGTQTGEAGLTAPELQIVGSASALGYVNWMSDYITRRDDHWEGTLIPDFSQEVALADDPAAMIDLIDMRLTAGGLSQDTRTAMTEVIDALPIRENNADTDRLSRARMAILMAVTSPEYMALD